MRSESSRGAVKPAPFRAIAGQATTALITAYIRSALRNMVRMHAAL